MKILSIFLLFVLCSSVSFAADVSSSEIVAKKKTIISNAVAELNKRSPREIDNKLSFIGASAELATLTMVYIFKVNILESKIRDRKELSGAMTKANRESICKTIVNRFDINARLDLVDKNDVFLSSSFFNKEVCNQRR